LIEYLPEEQRRQAATMSSPPRPGDQ
jgi:hypothetical protein